DRRAIPEPRKGAERAQSCEAASKSRKDRKSEDRKIPPSPIFLSLIFLSFPQFGCGSGLRWSRMGEHLEEALGVGGGLGPGVGGWRGDRVLGSAAWLRGGMHFVARGIGVSLPIEHGLAVLTADAHPGY